MDWDCLTVATFFLMVFLGVTVFSPPLPLGTVGSGGTVGGDGSGGGAVVG